MNPNKPMIDKAAYDYFLPRGFAWRLSYELVRRGEDGSYHALTPVLYQGNSQWQASGFSNESAYIDSDPEWIGPVFPDPITAYVNAEVSLWRAP